MKKFLQKIKQSRLRQGFGVAKHGFTLIETIVAIFILSMAMGALLTLAANGFYSVRYSRNQIVADNLVQEAIEYVRNTRDTHFLLPTDPTDPGAAYSKWVTLKTNILAPCFSENGCIVDVYSTGTHFLACSTQCPYMKYYENQGIYGYTYAYPFTGGVSYDTSYIRTIKMTPAAATDGHFEMTVTVRWLNGGTPKTVSQTIYFSDWRSYQPI